MQLCIFAMLTPCMHAQNQLSVNNSDFDGLKAYKLIPKLPTEVTSMSALDQAVCRLARSNLV